MKTRHRTPSIFNLSMVDVLCCALGCVILLWLLNLRMAKERAATIGQTSERLTSTQRYLDEMINSWLTASSERDQALKELESTQAALASLDKKLAALSELNTATEDKLTKVTREQEDLTKDRAAILERLLNLEKLLRDKDRLAKNLARNSRDLVEQLKDEEAHSARLQKDLEEARKKLVAAEARVEALEGQTSGARRELTEASRSLDTLQRENRVLLDQASRARAAMENRFEGIMLTGRRVIFMVDMSGSMELVSESRPDPNKWQVVRETVAKVMRSLPTLEKYQVIVFSEKYSFPLGNDGRWIDFDPKTSVDRVLRELAAVKPVGPTNMYDPFEAAFRYRPMGLDTIYVFSDGLPNVGKGLTPEQENTLKEPERSDILARYIRDLMRREWNREMPGQSRVRINTVGFFYESPDVGAFLWALARENDGGFVGMSKP